MTVPTLRDLVLLPTAQDRRLDRGVDVWLVSIVGGTRGLGLVEPATFMRYGIVRCAVIVVDADGAQQLHWVNPRNVYVRRP